ncbi:hypothetical protein AGIG_G17451 [Arapaima gigas]
MVFWALMLTIFLSAFPSWAVHLLPVQLQQSPSAATASSDQRRRLSPVDCILHPANIRAEGNLCTNSAQVTVCSRRRRNRESPAGQTGSHRSPPTGLRRTAFLRPLLIRRLKCRRGCGRL